MIIRLARCFLPALILALVAVACGGGDDDVTASTPTGDVVLGSGEIPETVPADFPIPEQAVVGGTVANTATGETEIVLRFPVDITATVDYFEENLAARGYVVDESAGRSDGGWDIAFSKDEIVGSINVVRSPQGITQAAVRFEGA